MIRVIPTDGAKKHVGDIWYTIQIFNCLCALSWKIKDINTG